MFAAATDAWMKGKACILFFVKFPEHGKVKTRLAKDIGDEQAVEFYTCFILDMLDTFADITVLHGGSGSPALCDGNLQVCICYTPESAEHSFKAWLGGNYVYLPQQGSDLGERMKNSFQQAFQSGFEQAVVIGSDLPDLPPHIIIKAFQELRAFDTVIGPAVDGGYYLLGFRHDTFCPEVFEGIPWSTASVFEQTLKRIQQAARTSAILPAWYDIDNLSDVQQLYHQHQHPNGRAVHTLSYLRAMKGGSL